MLANTLGDLRRVALINTNGGYIFRSADKKKSAQCFPGLVIAGIYTGDFGASGYVSADRCGK